MNTQIQATQTQAGDNAQEPLRMYHSILVALDSSDHANTGMKFSVELAGLTEGACITGVHAYAAKLHDVRFRQMEGGLPEQFREEQELERQRDVHDDLITRGLSIITDSYLDQADKNCRQANVDFVRRSLEGKNYRALTRETNSGNYDLLVMGALGLGAVEGSRLGTVCQRVTRRSDIDTLIIKQPERSLTEGPIVVAVDGSAMAYGGLITAMQLAQYWRVPIKVVAVFDPYFHYVAFNRIADVLSEEAGKVFRFKEQEKLHEEIIDSGLAKIYQGHLDVAQSIANEHNVDIETVLLDGKPHDAITRYIRGINPSLLIIGKLGIHADDELDIGGNAENLLQDVDCAVLLSQREHQPRIDVVADVTTSWTHEAEQAMDKVPGFARNMARMAILRYAQERGHTVITEKIVQETTSQLCPSHARQAMAEIVTAHEKMGSESKTESVKSELVDNSGLLDSDPIFSQTKGFAKLGWSVEAEALLSQTEDSSVRNNLRKRAEKKARVEGSNQVETKHLEGFISPSACDTGDTKMADTKMGSESINLKKGAADYPPTNSVIDSEPIFTTQSLHWQAAALARLMRVPGGFMRDSSQKHIEGYAQQQAITEITLEVAETGLHRAHEVMKQGMQRSDGTCPFDHNKKRGANSNTQPPVNPAIDPAPIFNWTPEAEQRMQRVPAGFMRNMTRQRIEAFAKRKGADRITAELIEQKYSEWNDGSQQQHMQLAWNTETRTRIKKIPGFVRGMVIKEVERCAKEMNAASVTITIMNKAMSSWDGMGTFHSEANPDLYKPGKD